ncbi:metallophosphoesterase [Stappia sp. 28M-7]|uniref:metallophosphoesterase family protein n=1 Tax=Stappia sp. 28M-7 TaxID=2762596 RepID=UPI00163CF317|nr:metallophosphoesterase family protein [Stappia sp. 28M-7]MBC2860255.1 metallophosphoesterase family protein [Stappia sp. 28M-7]
MRIAVLADIHGNAEALEAVVADLEREAPDEVVNLGDCLSGPLWPERTATILRSLGWPTVRGNHDRVVAAGNVSPANRTDHFTQNDLSAESLAWLRALPATLELDGGAVLLCHGTPTRDDVYLTEEVAGESTRLAAEQDIAARLGETAAGLVCCGHTHIPRLVHLAACGRTVLNPGSVGLPGYADEAPTPHRVETGSPHARYAMVERRPEGWRFEMKSIMYDWESAAREAERNGRPDWARPLRTGFYGPLA